MVARSTAPAARPLAGGSLAFEQAVASLRAGDALTAQRLLQQRLLQQPNDAAALSKLAELALAQGRTEDATVLLRRASVAQPSLARHLALVRHLSQFAGPAATLAEIESAPAEFRAAFDVQAIEAASLGLLGMHERQIAIYRRLTEAYPRQPALWKSFGDALKTVGAVDEAVAALRSAIAARPTYGEAYWTLANFKSFRFTDEDLAAMRKALASKPADVDALHFHFALGKAHEERGQHERAFRHYAEGNRIRASAFAKGQMYTTAFVDAAIATFTPDLFERNAAAGAGCTDEGPIFVVGLQRSGSTLVEQILASHPLIEGTTELTAMQELWERLGRTAAAAGRNALHELGRLRPEQLREIGEEYLERTRPFRLTGRPFFVDKLPANWLNLGLIRLALPKARIVDARRHPMACGFSNFKQHYATGVAFAYSLDSIGRFYRDYWRFMDHFDRVQPGAVHRVINERLIEDPDGEVRRLLDFVGVPFDPACLEFHRNKRAVRTPSAEQVRRPLNRDGVDAWRPFEPWLGPLKAALGPALDAWDRPPAES